MCIKKIPGQHYSNRYEVHARCLKTGATYKWPSIRAACDDGGFCYNMIKLCVAGQLASYSGLEFTTPTPRRTETPSPRIVEVSELYQKGLSHKEISSIMGVAIDTVKFHLQRARNLGLVELTRGKAVVSQKAV